VDTDRNLLFGVLALQADLLDPEKFARACSDWAAHKERPLADLLVERGWLSPDDRADVDKLLVRKLRKHGGDARAGLAEATSDEVRQSLASVADPDVRQSLGGATPAVPGHVLVSTTAFVPEARERYTLSRLHATGGIGRVWLARDASLGRDVALKELRPERGSNPAVWARFLREAQVTGQLEHPGIVPIYEVGRRPEDQAPFYTMRFVRGRTLSEASAAYHQRRARSEAGPLELRELLTAFVGVCNAAAYAHSRGVLHRDLKPHNVVLGDYGEVIVLDWGLARLMDQPDDEAAPLDLPAEGEAEATVQGQVLGTPAYMAPEQAEGRLDLLGPATDVYGLGSILYEVLTGRPPFTGAETAAVLRRVVHEAPARPRSLEKGAPAALEAVCLKALAKKPGERYATAKELADEVRRWLADEPVTAYREPLSRQVGRWARRHRTGVAVATALLVAGVAALGVTTVLVNRQRARAEANFHLARTAVDDMYTEVAEKWLAQESRMEPVQREFLIKALHFYEQFARPEGSSAEVRLEAGKAARRVGSIQHRLGESAAADAALRSSIETLRALARDRPDPVVRVELQKSLNRYGWLLWSLGRPPDDALREARDLGESLTQDPSAPVGAREELATAYSVLAIVDMACGRFADAEAAHGRALPLREAVAREDPTVEHREAVGRSHYHRARFFQRVGRFRESEAAFDRAVAQAGAVAADAPREPRPRVELANDLIEKAGLLSLLGRAKEAEADLRRGLALSEALVADFPSINEYKELQAALRRDLASLLNERRQTGDARQAYHTAIAEGEALVKEHPDVVSYRWNLCVHLSGLMTLEWGAGRFDEAEAPARRALELAEGIAAQVPARLDYRALAGHRRFEFADLLSNTGRKPAANPVYEQALAEYEALVRDCPGVPEYRHSLTQLLTRIGDRHRDEGNLAAAETAYDRSLPLAEGLARDFPEVPSYRTGPAAVRTSLAKLAVLRRDAARACGLLERSLRDLEAELKTNPDDGYAHSYRITNLGYLARVQAMEGDAAAAAATAGRLEESAQGPMEHYNAACYLSLLFKEVQDAPTPGPDRDALRRTLVDRAIAQLRKAKEAGLQGLGPLLDDPDFDPIRAREEFQALRPERGPANPPEKK
jgi:tetratricopeptide (TPR) repeat protein